MSKNGDSDGISTKVMVLGVMLLIAYLCWAIAASASIGPSSEAPGYGRGLWLMAKAFLSFLTTSLRFDKAPAVLENALRSERWILVLFAVLEIAAVLFGVWVKTLDTKLNAPKDKTRRQ